MLRFSHNYHNLDIVVNHPSLRRCAYKPGPIDNDNSLDYSFSSTSSMSTTLPTSPNILSKSDMSHHLSLVHCNVQSLYPKNRYFYVQSLWLRLNSLNRDVASVMKTKLTISSSIILSRRKERTDMEIGMAV